MSEADVHTPRRPGGRVIMRTRPPKTPMLARIQKYHELTPTQVVQQLKADLPDRLFHKVAMATFGNQRFFLKPEKFEQFLKSKKAPQIHGEPSVPLTLDWPGWYVLDAMASGDLSGDEAKFELALHYLELNGSDQSVVLNVLDKTWRAGVTQDTINQAKPGTFRPAKLMLAHKLKDRLEHDAKQLAKGKPATVKWPMVATAKYDGFRAAFEQASQRDLSREGNPFPVSVGLKAAQRILAEELQAHYGLGSVPALDGELFKGNWRDTAKARKEGIGYDHKIVFTMMPDSYIFGEPDGLDDGLEFAVVEFFEEVDRIIERRGLKEHLSTPDFRVVNNPEEEQQFFEEQLIKGLEGSVNRPLIHGYESKRSYLWLKHKNEEREDLVIDGIEYAEARSRNAGLAASVLVVREGLVSGCHGMSDKLRKQVTELHESGQLAGLIAEVEYHELTPDGILRHGVVKKIRFDKGANS